MRGLPGLLLLGAALAALVIWLVRRGEHEEGVAATVWRPSAVGFVYPELRAGTPLGAYLQDKEDFGIAVAGGGGRGYALAHGALRALRDNNILSRARYLSTTSGSVWTGLHLYYMTQDTLDEYFGTSMAPAELTPEVVTGPRAGTAITKLWYWARYPKGMPRDTLLSSNEEAEDASIRRAVEAEFGLGPGWLDSLAACLEHPCSCIAELALPRIEELWSIVSGAIFLWPFGLISPGSSLCHESELAEASASLGNHSKMYIARDMSRNLPFNVFQSAILAPYTGRDGEDPLVTWPLEHTALYTGTPPSIMGAQAAPYQAIGDALMSSYVWPGEVLDPVSDAPESTARVHRSMHWPNVGQLGSVAGIATSWLADFQVRDFVKNLSNCEITAVEHLFPHAPLWSPLAPLQDGRAAAQTAAVGDAGIYDDLGHIPLLRRGVKKMIIFDSSAVHDNTTGTGRDEVDICQMCYTRAAFGQAGCLPEPTLPGTSNPFSKAHLTTVFEPSEFDAFWEKVKEARARNESAVIRGNYTVVDNQLMGVRGGWQVEILWVLAFPDQQWHSQLPPRTRDFVQDFFPNLWSGSEMTNRFIHGAISQYGSWLVQNRVMSELLAMLGDGAAANAAKPSVLAV